MSKHRTETEIKLWDETVRLVLPIFAEAGTKIGSTTTQIGKAVADVADYLADARQRFEGRKDE